MVISDILEFDGYTYINIFKKIKGEYEYLIYENENNKNDIMVMLHDVEHKQMERKVIILDEFEKSNNYYLCKLSFYYSLAIKFIKEKKKLSDNVRSFFKEYETKDQLKDFILYNISEVLWYGNTFRFRD